MSAVVWEQGIAASPADASGRLPMVRADAEAAIAFGPDGTVTRAMFLAHVRGVAALLPGDAYMAEVEGLVTLRGRVLPPSSAPVR